MKAIRIHEFGGPDVLKLEEIPVPVPGEGQILVQVRAAGVNPADTYARSGNYAIKMELPFTPGSDGAGVVASVGAGVTRFSAGDRVYIARSVTGTYAEYTLALESQLHPLPDNITFAQGAGIYVPYGTAFHALHHQAGARAGEILLVHGASGGVGLAAVQWARAMGLQVFGTAGTEPGLKLAKEQGAHLVFDHTSPDHTAGILAATDGRGVDLILEMLANVNLAGDLKLLSQSGRVVIIGSRGEVTINPRDLMVHRGAIHAMMLWNITPEEAKEIHAAIGAGLANGTVRPVVGRELPLADAAESHRAVMEKGARGKIVLIP